MLTALKIKVAIIDDDENDYFIIADYLQEIKGATFFVDWYEDYDTALNKLSEKIHDIYFIDYRLGSRTGLEFIQEASLLQKNIPVVILTGKGNKVIDLATIQSGATDYLIKSELSPEKIERCVRYSLERTSALRELRNRENKYRNLFELSKDAVFIASPDLQLLEVNPAGLTLFGISPDQAGSCCFYDLISDPGQKKDVSVLISDGITIKDMEIELLNKNGEHKHCLFSLSFQQLGENNLLVNGVVHDITGLKKIEKANLLAQKLSANERLMRLLAHEIRNPLNNINLSVENFDLSPVQDETQGVLIDIIRRNSQRINQIITELLNHTRQEELQFDKHDLIEILNESIEITTDRINLQKITLIKNMPDGSCEMFADKDKLKIALVNIIINAIEAMSGKEGALQISLTTSGENITVSIKDNGVGIPEEILSRLAEPFFTSKKNGMGLGLAASYGILQSHGARIEVNSKVSQGTDFLISFKSLQPE